MSTAKQIASRLASADWFLFLFAAALVFGSFLTATFGLEIYGTYCMAAAAVFVIAGLEFLLGFIGLCLFVSEE